ncbi:hypothetical protein PoB_004740900 [Plakobranchus ocellatus]|uniref:Uncharacterized protein n=1 Tax=Plakobranchus ocellatus TaxID=259542 RepID=A0AAV4BPY7_9GAST|nr:hypothetical protein PoB_004740900 [Plakobranchus ocellatus]
MKLLRSTLLLGMAVFLLVSSTFSYAMEQDDKDVAMGVKDGLELSIRDLMPITDEDSILPGRVRRQGYLNVGSVHHNPRHRHNSYRGRSGRRRNRQRYRPTQRVYEA